MENRSFPGFKKFKSQECLEIKGKPLCFSLQFKRMRARNRTESPKFAKNTVGSGLPVTFTNLSSAFPSFLATISSLTAKKSRRGYNQSLNSSMKKNEKPDSQYLNIDKGLQIYKCVSNPNVSNSVVNTPSILRTNTSTEISVIHKRPRPSKKTSNIFKLKNTKNPSKKETLTSTFQKCFGVQLKREDSISFKYFLGSGNNSELIFRVMKHRKKWKRVYSTASANFIWTSNKIYSIYNYLDAYEPDANRKAEISLTEYPEVIPQVLSYNLTPYKLIQPSKTHIYNRLSGNQHLAFKKLLFFNMCEYYNSLKINPFTKIPLTFHVSYGSFDSKFHLFREKFMEIQATGASNVWIVKPGEFTNRGFGIQVCKNLAEVIESVNCYECDYERTHIIQKYIDRPLLYNKRKFDIRCYSVITSVQGNIQCYFFKEGYLRTSSVEYSLNNVENRYIHLTNDAVQKYSLQYGKHESGNKLSFEEFQTYLASKHPDRNFYEDLLPQIKELVKDTAAATYGKIDTEKKLHSFEIFGYDFMVDSDFHVWLIEVNTNPCLELSSSYLEQLIPKMLDQAFALTLDSLFPCENTIKSDFELVFNEAALNL